MPRIDQSRIAEVVGRAIAKHRVASNLTQEQVAERLGIGNEAVSRIERGIVIPTIVRLVELAEIFDCDVSELLTEASHRASDQANYLSKVLAKLHTHDRTLVLEVVERLAARLARR